MYMLRLGKIKFQVFGFIWLEPTDIKQISPNAILVFINKCGL